MKKSIYKIVTILLVVIILMEICGNCISMATETNNNNNNSTEEKSDNISVKEGKLYINNELAKNKKYVITKDENFTSEIKLDENNSSMSIEDYIPYVLTTTKVNDLYLWQAAILETIQGKNENIKEKYESCIWETDADGKLVKLGDTSDYTGIYNGRVYKNSTILTDTVIAVDKGTNIETNDNKTFSYEEVENLTVKELGDKEKTKDIIFINEQGKVQNNVLKSDSKNLIGDVNLDGEVSLVDVILLNKYLAGLVVLSDQQKLNADCYSDGVIDDFDSMALIKFVILLIDNLPEYPEAIEAKKRNNGIDEFYKENIENSVGNFDLVKIAKTVKNKLSAQEDAKYTNGNLKLEDLYKEGKFVNGINGSSFIEMCLYQYSIYQSNKSVKNYILDNEDKLTNNNFYDMTNEDLEKLGWQKYEYVDKNDILKGDILVSEDKVQIYEGYGSYACNEESEVKSRKLSKVIEPGDGRYIIRTEPKEGKCGDEVNWKIENNVLKISGEGDMYDYKVKAVPWIASAPSIVGVNFSVNGQINSDKLWVGVVDSMQGVKNKSTLTIENMSSCHIADAVKIIRREIINRQCSTLVTKIYANKDSLDKIVVEFYNGYMMGIDVSEWQGEIDWEQVKKAGIDFAILRCGYGQSGEDVTFKRNYRKARAAGIPIGTYYFSYATTMEEFDGEVKHLQSLLEGKAFELPVYMDFEQEIPSYTEFAKRYCTLMQEAGYTNIGVYANALYGFGNDTLDLSQISDNVSTWAANYPDLENENEITHHKWHQYDIWQYSSKGNINGINANVDLNIMYSYLF